MLFVGVDIHRVCCVADAVFVENLVGEESKIEAER